MLFRKVYKFGHSRSRDAQMVRGFIYLTEEQRETIREGGGGVFTVVSIKTNTISIKVITNSIKVSTFFHMVVMPRKLYGSYIILLVSITLTIMTNDTMITRWRQLLSWATQNHMPTVSYLKQDVNVHLWVFSSSCVVWFSFLFRDFHSNILEPYRLLQQCGVNNTLTANHSFLSVCPSTPQLIPPTHISTDKSKHTSLNQSRTGLAPFSYTERSEIRV